MQHHLHSKKVGLKPGADDETKRTNEIGTVIPLLDQLDNIAAKTFTADALLTPAHSRHLPPRTQRPLPLHPGQISSCVGFVGIMLGLRRI